MDTYETEQPWITYHYGLTHDLWWPFWTSTRVLGYCKIGLTCCVCGTQEVAKLRIPRFGPVPEPEGGKHAYRVEFMHQHEHPDRGHPMSWALPLRNAAVFPDGLPLDLLGMRLEADINQNLGE